MQPQDVSEECLEPLARRVADLLDEVERLRPDVLALQECTSAFLDAVRSLPGESGPARVFVHVQWSELQRL